MSDMIKIEDKTLFFSGDVSLVDNRDRIVAVVGARSASSWGLKAAARIGERLAQAGFIVCNGLAAGIDTAAVEGALSSDGRVIAALPGSLDNVYPKANAGLAARIIEGGGLLVSEHDSGHQLNKADFISRDDVQAMLSSRCVVVECSENGGTMHTVRFCLKRNVPIGAVTRETETCAGCRIIVDSGWGAEIGNGDDLDRFVSGS